jgi:cystathionine gamma-lyase
MREDPLDFETLAVRGEAATGDEPDARTAPAGDVVPPVHLSAPYVTESADDFDRGYTYARLGNPTRDALERRLATLHGADHATAFASGTAATLAACLAVLEPGDHLVSFDSLYAGTKVVFDELLGDRLDVSVSYVDATDPANVTAAVRPETALVWVESPTNPLLKLCDLDAVASVLDDRDAAFAVDNTFASPYLQQPLALGADLAVYSTTKFVNGHSDAVGGAVVTDDETLGERVGRVGTHYTGSPLPPFDCYLTLRGLKTLPARVDRHERNATQIAEFLADHPAVERVYYPGLDTHPQHDLAARQMSGFGGVVSFEVDGDAAQARAFVESLDCFDLATSLGGVESLIEHTASMSASYLSAEERRAAGITGSLVRAPVGIESADDLVADLDRGLARL